MLPTHRNLQNLAFNLINKKPQPYIDYQALFFSQRLRDIIFPAIVAIRS